MGRIQEREDNRDNRTRRSSSLSFLALRQYKCYAMLMRRCEHEYEIAETEVNKRSVADADEIFLGVLWPFSLSLFLSRSRSSASLFREERRKVLKWASCNKLQLW